MTEHTPGPWISNADKREVLARKTNTKLPGMEYYFAVATVERTKCAGADEEAQANARLIAAAPDLLAALEELVAEFDADSDKAAQEQGCGGLNESGGIVLARMAIRKARGA